MMAPLKYILATCIAFATFTAGAAGVSFTREIAPILQAKCVACHNLEKAKGHYQLHTFELLLKPGSSGSPAVTAGKPDASELFRLLNEKSPDNRMPQKDDALPAKQTALIEKWIREGAKFDGPDAKANLATYVTGARTPEAPKIYTVPVPITALAITVDGKEVITSGYYELTVWNLADHKLVRRIKGAPQRTFAMAFSPDGKQLAVAGGSPGLSGEVKLFDIASGRSLKTLSRLRDTALCLAFSTDGKTLAAGAADNTIRLYDVATQKQKRLIEQHADWVLALDFNEDGTRLASASRDKSSRTFDTKTGVLLDNYVAHEEHVVGIGFVAGTNTVVSAGRDRKIHVWPLEASMEKKKDGKDKGKKVNTFNAEGTDLTRLLNSGDRLFLGSTDSRVREYDLTKRTITGTFGNTGDEITALAFDVKNNCLAAGTSDGHVFLWDAANRKKLTSFIAAPGYKKPETTLAK